MAASLQIFSCIIIHFDIQCIVIFMISFSLVSFNLKTDAWHLHIVQHIQLQNKYVVE